MAIDHSKTLVKKIIHLLFTLMLGLHSLKVMALSFPLPENGDDIIGETGTVTTRYEDTLSDIARLNDLGYL